MKKCLTIAFLVSMVVLTVYFQKDIVNYILEIYYGDEYHNTVIVSNKYKNNFNYLYVSDSFDITPHSISNIKNIYYTILNSGMTKVSFFCDEEYEKCTDDILMLSEQEDFLGILNNYIHPYNSYQYIATDVNGYMNTVYVTKNYTDRMIEEINSKIDQIISEKIDDSMSTREKIRVIHDYIINTTKYEKTTNSHLAYGALIENKAVCGGYTDAMSIFLYKLNIPNYKVNNADHIWNLVKIDNTWYHLDLTWDDPINDFRDILTHEYFLLTTVELDSKNDISHVYDKQKYLETK